MIFLNYTKNNIKDCAIADAIFYELNSLFPDQVFQALLPDSEFGNKLSNSSKTENYFIFLSSKEAYEDALFGKNLDHAGNYKDARKIKKCIEIKLDDVQTPHFMKKGLIGLDFKENIKEINQLIIKGVNHDTGKDFQRESNFIYIKTYYKNVVEKNEAVLVNENEQGDVIILKIKAMHDDVTKGNYSIIADQPGMDNFYSSKPKVTPSEDNKELSPTGMKSQDIFTKLVEPLDESIIKKDEWQSFVFFKEVFDLYQIKKITLVFRDLTNRFNYTIDVL